VTVASGLQLLVAGVKRKAWRHTGGQNSRARAYARRRASTPPSTVRAAARTHHRRRPPGPEPLRLTPITLDVRAAAVEVSTARGAFGAAASHITSRPWPPPASVVNGSSSSSSLAAVAAL